jgi:hypothetical protein
VSSLDDDALDRTLARRPLSSAERETLARARSVMTSGDFAAPRPSRHFAVELVVAGAAAVLVIGLILALAHPTPPAPQPAVTHPTASPTASPIPPVSTVATPRIVGQLSLGSLWINAVTSGPGVVWVAAQQSQSETETGRLIRVDASTARQTASWVIGGDPDAVATAGDYVWVANGDGDFSSVLPGENTVEQFSVTTGKLIHVYHVVDPLALVANPGAALVISGPTQNNTQISLLTSGRDDPIASEDGAPTSTGVSDQPAIASCGGQVYMPFSDVTPAGARVIVYAMPESGGPIRSLVTLPNDFLTNVTCNSTSLFVASSNGQVARIDLANPSHPTVLSGGYPYAMTFALGRVWTVYLLHNETDQPFLTSMDPTTWVQSPAELSPPAGSGLFDRYALIPGTPGLWMVAGNGNLLLHIAVG